MLVMYFLLFPSEPAGIRVLVLPSKQVSVCDIVDLLSVLLPSELVDVCVVGEDFNNPSELCLRC